jgi:cyclopropane fatty-acyl-phospholipid synthase-like methyltransferase
MDRHDHWNAVYSTKGERDVSWFEASPELSLRMIEAAGLTSETCVLDVGGGDSRLVDALVARGAGCVGVLDVSRAALLRAQARLSDRAGDVAWIQADVSGVWSWKDVDIWHDRAMFHFLAEQAQRETYTTRLLEMLKPQGFAIIATFAPDGPATCSGLPVVRYSSDSLAAALGDRFDLIESRPHAHTTPWGATQTFQYSRFRKR